MSNNRYTTVDLNMPDDIHKYVSSLVGSAEGRPMPFARQIDLWWAGLCVGLRRDERLPIPSETTKFATGVILDSDSWRVSHLDLIALSLGGPELLERPGDVIRLASEYAYAGMRWIVDEIAAQSEPTLSFTNRVRDLVNA